MTDFWERLDYYKELSGEMPSAWQKNQDMLSWGFPYKYTVFPLKDESDELDEETSSLSGKIEYTNLALEDAYTMGSCLGYGHNVTASKSEDPKNVIIEWDKPYITGLKMTVVPVLWARESGTNKEYKKVTERIDASGKFIYSLTGENRTKAFDFAVTYRSAIRASDLHDTYVEYLLSIKDGNKENLNKGYAFAIELTALNVHNNGLPTTNEQFSWLLWDFEKRAVGPDSNYNLSILNYDYSTEPQLIATIDKDGTIHKSDNDKYFIDFIDFSENNVSLTIAPNTFYDESNQYKWYKGLLKVLRDYKHYGVLEATRTNSEGKKIKASYADNEKDIYATRIFTNEELFRSTTLIIAQALEETNVSGSNTVNQTLSGDGGGSFFWTRVGGDKITGSGIDELRWTVTNYKHIWKSFPVQNANTSSPITINDTAGGMRGRKYSGSAAKDKFSIRFLGTTAFGNFESDYNKTIPFVLNLTFPEDFGYTSAIIEFNQSDDSLQGTVKIGDDSTSISATGKDGVKYWSPIRVAANSFGGDDTTKGWK